MIGIEFAVNDVAAFTPDNKVIPFALRIDLLSSKVMYNKLIFVVQSFTLEKLF